MSRPHNAKVPAIRRQNLSRREPLGYRDDRGVDEAKREITVGVNEIGDSREVFVVELFDDELAIRDRANERFLGGCPDPSLKEVADFW